MNAFDEDEDDAKDQNATVDEDDVGLEADFFGALDTSSKVRRTLDFYKAFGCVVPTKPDNNPKYIDLGPAAAFAKEYEDEKAKRKTCSKCKELGHGAAVILAHAETVTRLDTPLRTAPSPVLTIVPATTVSRLDILPGIVQIKDRKTASVAPVNDTATSLAIVQHRGKKSVSARDAASSATLKRIVQAFWQKSAPTARRELLPLF
ncbi:MAG: hypothetical protein LQ347_000573 [Umbilicaria vellea]|nr:MAG: hypothetical protein LQ347_000573 [Umbilicaria vellea]